jgi:hypothetical protein
VEPSKVRGGGVVLISLRSCLADLCDYKFHQGGTKCVKDNAQHPGEHRGSSRIRD